jgi:hypothetical protein
VPEEQAVNGQEVRWAAPTKPFRRALQRMRTISSNGSRWQQEVSSQSEAGTGRSSSHIEQDAWQRAWHGDKVFWTLARKLHKDFGHKSGMQSPLQLPMQQLDRAKRRQQGEALPKMLRAMGESDGPCGSTGRTTHTGARQRGNHGRGEQHFKDPWILLIGRAGHRLR